MMRILTLLFFLFLPLIAFGQQSTSSEEIQRLVELYRKEALMEKQAARELARSRNLPVVIRHDEGPDIELMRIRHGVPVYYKTLNARAAQTTRTMTVYPDGILGLDLTGRNMRLGIWDSGHVRRTHQELTGRVTWGDDADLSNHATHVGGTLIAAGVRPEARGMAYEARLVSYDWNADISEMLQEAARGLLISNHSYGPLAGWEYADLETPGNYRWYWVGNTQISDQEDYQFGRYDGESERMDRAVTLRPYYLPVFAAGNDRTDTGPGQGQTFRAWNYATGQWETYNTNDWRPPPDGGTDGFDTIAGAAVAKNVLTIGSVGDRIAPSTPIRISNFSSFGPTDDGRIKPDVVGNGESLISSLADSDTQYGSYSGTSMATPNVAGSILLLQQLHEDMFGRPLQAATLKAVILHTAEDAGNPGPDYKYGWGLLNMEQAASQITELLVNQLAVWEDTLFQGETIRLTGTMEEQGPLRVTLCWTDRPGTVLPAFGPEALDNPTLQLKNDLDVRVIHEETGTTYYPYVLDPEHPQLPATTGDNFRDPVEQIWIPDAMPGTYTIQITHKGATLVGDTKQPFGLVVTGILIPAPSITLKTFEATGTPSTDSVTLTWTAFEQVLGVYTVERIPLSYNEEGNVIEGEPLVVGTLSSQGISSEPHTYQFVDTAYMRTDPWLQSHIPAGDYWYRLKFTPAGSGTPNLLGEVPVTIPAPTQFVVIHNYPNPFSQETHVILDVPVSTFLRASLYDVLGRKVATLIDRQVVPGRYELHVDAHTWAAGVYIVRVETAEGTQIHPVLKIR